MALLGKAVKTTIFLTQILLEAKIFCQKCSTKMFDSVKKGMKVGGYESGVLLYL